MNEYLFDIKLFASIRIKAESEAEARATILDHLEDRKSTRLNSSH